MSLRKNSCIFIGFFNNGHFVLAWFFNLSMMSLVFSVSKASNALELTPVERTEVCMAVLCAFCVLLCNEFVKCIYRCILACEVAQHQREAAMLGGVSKTQYAWPQ